MPAPIPFTLPEGDRRRRAHGAQSSALDTITSELDRTVSGGMSALKHAAGVVAEPLIPFAQALGTGISVPSLEDLTPDWIKDQQQKASALAQQVTSGITVPSLEGPDARLDAPHAADGALSARNGQQGRVWHPWPDGQPARGGTSATVDAPAAERGRADGGRGQAAGTGAPTVARPGAGLDPASIRALPGGAIDTRQGGDAVLRQLAPSFLAVERGGGRRPATSARWCWPRTAAGSLRSQRTRTTGSRSRTSLDGSTRRARGTGGRFARYESPQASLADFVDLISTAPRYQEAWALRNAPPEQFFGALAKAGYIVPEPRVPRRHWLQNTAQGAARFDRAAARVQLSRGSAMVAPDRG